MQDVLLRQVIEDITFQKGDDVMNKPNTQNDGKLLTRVDEAKDLLRMSLVCEIKYLFQTICTQCISRDGVVMTFSTVISNWTARVTRQLNVFHMADLIRYFEGEFDFLST